MTCAGEYDPFSPPSQPGSPLVLPGKGRGEGVGEKGCVS